VGVYTKSKTSELSPLRRKLLRFAKQFPPPLRSKNHALAQSLLSRVFSWDVVVDVGFPTCFWRSQNIA
jgi:hypothetical protein